MRKHSIPLHPAQQDVYMDQLLNTESPEYNIGGYIVLKGNLDKGKFQEAVNSGPAVFDAFKMRFDTNAADFQYYYDENFTRLNLTELDFSDKPEAAAYAEKWAQDSFNTPFI